MLLGGKQVYEQCPWTDARMISSLDSITAVCCSGTVSMRADNARTSLVQSELRGGVSESIRDRCRGTAWDRSEEYDRWEKLRDGHESENNYFTSFFP